MPLLASGAFPWTAEARPDPVPKTDGNRIPYIHWGQAGDIPVPADYNGDRTTDIATWRPSDGMWRILNGPPPIHWGESEDIPVPADYDGDGKVDVAIWRPRDGSWWVALRTGYFLHQQLGAMGDVPLPTNYNVYGRAFFDIWRPSIGIWFHHSGAQTYGPFLGDFPNSRALRVSRGIGWCYAEQISFWNELTGVWSFPEIPATVQWGTAGDIPVPGYYEGSSMPTNLAVFRPANGGWYIRKTPFDETGCIR